MEAFHHWVFGLDGPAGLHLMAVLVPEAVEAVAIEAAGTNYYVHYHLNHDFFH